MLAVNTSNVLVSVVVPVYNVEKCMDRCIESILSQTYENLQIILVNDGSTDYSGDKCAEWANTDSRIMVLHQPNGGLSAARNTGMGAVKGDYVVFVDSDDAIGTNHIMNLLNAASSVDADTVVAVTGSKKSNCVDSPVGELVLSTSINKMTPEEAVIVSVTIGERFAAHAWGKLYPRRLYPLLKFPVGKYYEDQYVTYKVLLGADVVVYEDADDYCYTVDRDESISNSSRLHLLDYLEGIRETLHDVKAICPGAADAVYLRYLISLGGCLKITASEGGRKIFEDLFSEAVKNRRQALALPSLGTKVRVQFLFTYLGKRLSRALFRLHDLIRSKNMRH